MKYVKAKIVGSGGHEMKCLVCGRWTSKFTACQKQYVMLFTCKLHSSQAMTYSCHVCSSAVNQTYCQLILLARPYRRSQLHVQYGKYSILLLGSRHYFVTDTLLHSADYWATEWDSMHVGIHVYVDYVTSHCADHTYLNIPVRLTRIARTICWLSLLTIT